MSTNLIMTEQIGSVLQEIEEAYFEIPFENSNFQNKAFVMASQQTPARAYRAIGLRMFAKIRAVKEYLIQKEKDQIDLDEWEAEIANPDTNEFNRRRRKLDILQKTEQRKWGEKLLNDALTELTCLFTEFKKFPKYDRVTFEREEANHYQAKLTRSLQANPTMESLLSMTDDLLSWDKKLQHAELEMKQFQELLENKK